jgi:phytoene dehydrogenase-like protein
LAYDVIVIGAGHNGLVCATLLAKAGRKVLILEARESLGGLCAGEEFQPGFRHVGLLNDTSGLRPWVVEALGLKQFGLGFEEKWPRIFSPDPEGEGLCVTIGEEGDGGLESPLSESWRRFFDFVNLVRPVVEPLVNQPPVDLAQVGLPEAFRLFRHGLAVRRLGRRDMMELVRIPPMCAADWLREWFPRDHVCAILALPAMRGAWMGPWSPGSAANLLLYLVTLQRPVAGGPAELIRVLARAAGGAGVEVRTLARVTGCTCEGAKVTGVKLEDGETLSASCVVATCDPHQVFMRLLPRREIGSRLETRIAHYRRRGTTARVNLALHGEIEWSSPRGAKAHYVRTGASLAAMERAFDAVKYRRFSERPVLDIHLPTRARPELAPPGGHVMSIQVHFAPYELDGGWTESAREELYQTVQAELARHAPRIRDLVAGYEVLTPADIEARYGTTGGHLHHGEHALDQLLVRPIPEAFCYATPFAGLYLGGSGSHPGGGVTGAPGALAARTLLES